MKRPSVLPRVLKLHIVGDFSTECQPETAPSKSHTLRVIPIPPGLPVSLAVPSQCTRQARRV
jgi:hypothetical protein